MSKIVIVVRGGCVSAVYCDDATAEVDLLDFDNAEAVDEDGSQGPDWMDTAAMDAAVEIAEQTLAEVF